MPLPTNLRALTARELHTALIIASRKKSAGEKSAVLREFNRRGIRPFK